MWALINGFLAVICLGINVLFHIFIVRTVKGMNFLRSVFMGYFFGAITLLMVRTGYLFFNEARSSLETFASVLAGMISYSALSYCYFHFINLGETARRIRLVRELYNSSDGLFLSEILERYNAHEIVERRISRLLNSGQVALKDGSYFIKGPLLLLISKVIVVMKVIMLGKKSEFD